jgi:hypothetical protein
MFISKIMTVYVKDYVLYTGLGSSRIWYNPRDAVTIQVTMPSPTRGVVARHTFLATNAGLESLRGTTRSSATPTVTYLKSRYSAKSSGSKDIRNDSGILPVPLARLAGFGLPGSMRA